MGLFECFGYSLKKYNNDEISFANYIKQMHVNKTKTISLHSYNNENVRYWVIPVNNVEFYLFFDENFDIVGWDFVSNTGVTNKFKIKATFKNLKDINDWFGFGFVQIESGVCPLNLCVVNYDAITDNDVDKELDFEVTLFTEEIEVFKNEKVFYKKQREETKFSSESIIPVGMFPGRRLSSIWLNGKVINVQKKCNDLAYYSLVVECCGIKFNVLTTEKVGKKISFGNILTIKGDIFSKVLKQPIKHYEVR